MPRGICDNLGDPSLSSSSGSSMVLIVFVVICFSGLVGTSRRMPCLMAAEKMFLPSSLGPLARLLLCPGTFLIGLSSSASFSLAVAFATPHAGVGLSSAGDELEEADPELDLIMLLADDVEPMLKV